LKKCTPYKKNYLKKIMRVTIVGSGAMGCLFGGMLTEAGVDVHLLDIWQEHVNVLNTKGLSITSNGQERFIPVRAYTDPGKIVGTDLALIFVKHGQTEKATETAKQLIGKNGAVLTLQNGMGNAEIIAGVVGQGRIICGTTSQGAMLLGPGKIQHSGMGKTNIGMWDSKSLPVLQQVATIFSRANIATTTVDDIKPVLWSKLFANVGINAITALTGIRNGQLLDLSATQKLVKDVVNEAIKVATALQIPVAEDALENVFAIAKATASNRSSMGQDVDASRMTEIDAINGYIIRNAKKTRIEVPVNIALATLIQTLQVHYHEHIS
jgi:2-dehydropantoate 2-reductase